MSPGRHATSSAETGRSFNHAADWHHSPEGGFAVGWLVLSEARQGLQAEFRRRGTPPFGGAWGSGDMSVGV